MCKRLVGKTALITGGGGGIGSATSIRLASEGAAVVVADLFLEKAEAVAAGIRNSGGDAIALAVDIGSEESIAKLLPQIIERYGKLDILHNNAALTDPKKMDLDVFISTLPTELWDENFAVNARGTMLDSRYALPHLVAAGKSSVINTSTASTLMGHIIHPAYAASKAAIDIFTKYLATQYGKFGLRANAVLPGAIMTKASIDNTPKELWDRLEEHALTPHLGQPEDIAATVAFLASEDARFITAQIITVDGGYAAHYPTFGALPADPFFTTV